MALQDEIRNDLDTEIFAVIGKEVVLTSLTSPTYNDRGEEETVASSLSTITVVPYDITSDKRTHQAFGNLNEGEMDMAVRYDVIINIGDQTEIDSNVWEVLNISKNFLPDNVVTIVRLAKDHN